MKTYPYMKVIAVACAGALASCASQPETRKVPVSASFRPDSSLSGEILQEVNSYRRTKGATNLQRHAGLDRMAQQHCEYLRKNRGTFDLYGKNVSHYGFEGRSAFARESYQMLSVSENVASASKSAGRTAPTLVRLWAGSKNHEYNMRSSWTHTGVGVVVDDDGTVFATQLFATVSNTQMSTRERFNRF